MINLSVKGERITVVGTDSVSDSIRYLTVKLNFDEVWDGYEKTLLFFNIAENAAITVPLVEGSTSQKSENEWYVPWEVIKIPSFTVSVIGIKNENNENISRITTAPVTVNIAESGLREGEQPRDPTPSEYEQILAAAEEAVDTAQSALGIAESFDVNANKVGSVATITVNNGKGVEKSVQIKDGDDPVFPDSEWHFNGGSAESPTVDISYTIDDVFNTLSGHAISNRTVAAFKNETEDDISDLENALQTAISTTIPALIASAKQEAINAAHPVGSYYWSSASTNPSNLFGGTWVQIKDKFVLAAGDDYSAGATGGASTVTLTVDEMPSHNHKLYGNLTTKDIVENQRFAAGETQNHVNYLTTAQADVTDYVGGGEAHNNMPPYVVAYCWKRTA